MGRNTDKDQHLLKYQIVKCYMASSVQHPEKNKIIKILKGSLDVKSWWMGEVVAGRL